MRSRLLHHWPAKLASLGAAAVVWYLLGQAIRSQESAPAPRLAPAVPGRFP